MFKWIIGIFRLDDNMSFDYTVIGKRIKKIREKQGYTQEKVAETLGVSSAYISKIEIGKTSLSIETLASICECLEISPIFVLTGTLPKSEDYLRNDIEMMLRECSPEKIQLISEIVLKIVEYKE
ncbi:helix-turn-helix transcriptional regulator [Cellulosilyticum sp. ST5]|uniref:helix-turn-helix domain-containing protein n=1 Tax=Cellulosilyticum sp. ST5 TaxID=3055805 RepID=UPI003977269A